MKRLFLLAGIVLPIAICPIQAQYPTVPDSVKQRAAQENAIHHKLSEAAWKKALKTVKKEEKKYGRVYRPWASKPEDLPQCQIPAFPGAEGGGAFTAGGRGGKVFTVTSLEDRGPGTLREACESGGARIVVFNVAGVIRLKSPISIKAPYITIAGQTAPGDGVCVTGASFLIDTHDVIIRHMRFRRGAVDVADRDDALGGNAVGNIILDHISASWGLDEVMSIYRHVWNRDETGKGTKLPTVNITIQNSMFAEALDTYNHAFGATIGGHNCYFARNLFASNISRNCSVGMNGGFNLVNSVIYNWWNRSIDGGDEYSQFNIINNYFKPGPITALQTGRPIQHRILKPESSRDKNKPDTFGKAYVSGNIMLGNDKVTADNWDGGVQVYGLKDCGKFENEIRVDTPFEMPIHNPILSAQDAYEFVMENVGATLPERDSVDTRIICTVRTGQAIYDKKAKPYTTPYVKRRLPDDSYKYGIITHPEQVGGLPEYNGAPYVDSDNDGMPDEWEKRFGLDPNDPTDAAKDCNGDGYTNIEKYINDIDPSRKIDWTDLRNNHDTLKERLQK